MTEPPAAQAGEGRTHSGDVAAQDRSLASQIALWQASDGATITEVVRPWVRPAPRPVLRRPTP